MPLSFRTFALMPITYEHSPRPVGGPIHFSLEGDQAHRRFRSQGQ